MVDPSGLEELVVRPALGDLAVLQHHDLVHLV